MNIKKKAFVPEEKLSDEALFDNEKEASRIANQSPEETLENIKQIFISEYMKKFDL